MPLTTTRSERIDRCTRRRRFFVRFNRSESFIHTRSSVEPSLRASLSFRYTQGPASPVPLATLSASALRKAVHRSGHLCAWRGARKRRRRRVPVADRAGRCRHRPRHAGTRARPCYRRHDRHGHAGSLAQLAIGMTLTFNILMGGALTGAPFNPARALGPMVATGNFSDAWLYLTAPIVGAIVAALLHTGLARLAGERTTAAESGRAAQTPAE